VGEKWRNFLLKEKARSFLKIKNAPGTRIVFISKLCPAFLFMQTTTKLNVIQATRPYGSETQMKDPAQFIVDGCFSF